MQLQVSLLAFLALATAAPSSQHSSNSSSNNDQPQTSIATGETDTSSSYMLPQSVQNVLCGIMHSHHDETTGELTSEGIQKFSEALKDAPLPVGEVEAELYVEIEGVEYLVPEDLFETEGFERDSDLLEDGVISVEEFIRKYGLERARDG